MSWRLLAGALVAVSRGSLPAIAIMGLLAQQPIALLSWVRVLSVFALLPGIAAWLIERSFMTEVDVGPAEIVLRRSDLRLHIPSAAIARVAPWDLPLPGPGFSLWMRSGRRLRYGVQVDDPALLLSAFAHSGAETVPPATPHPSLVYAHAKASVGQWLWYQPLVKYVLFALAPTAVWFNAHQHIAYGGLLGQYYVEGLGPYVKTWCVSWCLVSIYLVLYASLWRGLAEGMALLAAWLAPLRAARVRRVVEIACRLAYYGGVPVIVLVPFLL